MCYRFDAKAKAFQMKYRKRNKWWKTNARLADKIFFFFFRIDLSIHIYFVFLLYILQFLFLFSSFHSLSSACINNRTIAKLLQLQFYWALCVVALCCSQNEKEVKFMDLVRFSYLDWVEIYYFIAFIQANNCEISFRIVHKMGFIFRFFLLFLYSVFILCMYAFYKRTGDILVANIDYFLFCFFNFFFFLLKIHLGFESKHRITFSQNIFLRFYEYFASMFACCPVLPIFKNIYLTLY